MQLVESWGFLVKPEELLKLCGCTFSNYNKKCVCPARQKGLEWFSCSMGGSSSNYYAAAMKIWFTSSKDKDKNTLWLEICSLRPEDTDMFNLAKYTVNSTVSSDANLPAGTREPAGGTRSTQSSGSQRSLLREAKRARYLLSVLLLQITLRILSTGLVCSNPWSVQILV